MLSRIVLIFLATVAAVVAAGCGGGEDARSGPTVVAGFYPAAFLAERIGGDGIRVVDLTQAGAEPHDLELSPRDVQTVQDADLVVHVGGGFQPQLERALEGRSGPTLDLLAGQELRTAGGKADPHVWLDPSRLAASARAVGRALGLEPAGEALAGELEALDRRFRKGLARCARRELVTSHAAFGYLADRYGLRQVALTGVAPEAEPGPRALEELVREVERTGATTVFFESLLSPALAETVAREAGARVAELDPLEGLGEVDRSAGRDYLSVMTENLQALREALGCR